MSENKMTIKCNNVPREIIYGFELSEKQKAEFDYLEGESLETNSFVKYKGQIYDLGEFMAIDRQRNHCYSGNEFAKFDGYCSDSYFSGVLVKFVDSDFVVMATYYS